MWAASSGSEQCVDMLLPYSDATATTGSGFTALDIAQAYVRQASAQQIRRHMIDEGSIVPTGAVAPDARPGVQFEPGTDALPRPASTPSLLPPA
jgi:ankyrin repeat protein